MSKIDNLTLLAAGEYQLAQVEAPGVPDAEMKEALRWKLKDLVDATAEDATFDLLPMPESGAGRPRQVLLGVAAKSVPTVGPEGRFFLPASPSGR